jgi:hypothetical protein
MEFVPGQVAYFYYKGQGQGSYSKVVNTGIIVNTSTPVLIISYPSEGHVFVVDTQGRPTFIPIEHLHEHSFNKIVEDHNAIH